MVGEYNDFLSFPDDDEQVLLKSSFSGLHLADDVQIQNNNNNNKQNKNTCIHRRVTDKKKNILGRFPENIVRILNANQTLQI